MLSLTETRRITRRAGEKLKTEGCACHAVQSSRHHHAAAATSGCCDHRIVLQTIRPGAGIAMDDGLHTVGVAVKLQVDPEAGVRENGVAEDCVVDGGVVMHPDSGEKGITHRSAAAVEGDDVARVGGGAAYRIVVTVNNDPARRVGQRLSAGDVGADNIALDEVAGAAGSEDNTGVASIAGDQIAGRCTRSSCQAADEVIGGAIDVYACVRVRQGDCACNVCADEVALDRVVGSAEQVNATGVGGDDVTGSNGRTADEVI